MDMLSDNPTTIGIIGGGVAGMSCALWLRQLGYTPIIIEQQAELGGQLRHLQRINRWVLGHPNQTSAALAQQYAAHILQENLTCLCNVELRQIACADNDFNISLNHQGQQKAIAANALVIATGARVVGAEMFTDTPGFSTTAGIGFYPTDHIDKLAALAGKTVVVIGGGDNAHFTAKDLALAGAKVHLLIRNQPKARVTIRRDVLELSKQGSIVEHLGVGIAAFQQIGDSIMITLSSGESLTADYVFARLGFAANTDFLQAFTAFAGINKTKGYIQTNNACQTSIKRVYAIGDAANAEHQSVVNALAEGARAAQAISEEMAS